jgi:hypothetical protein
MGKLDLNAYGVSEMSVNEMEKVDGGSWFTFLAATVCIIVGVITFDAALVGLGVLVGTMGVD